MQIAMPCVLDLRVVKARAWDARAGSVHGVFFKFNEDIYSQHCCRCFERVRTGEGALEVSGLSHFWALATSHARVNCRCFLAGQFFWRGDACRWAFESRVPCASTWLGSNIVCSIDEKVA